MASPRGSAPRPSSSRRWSGSWTGCSRSRPAPEAIFDTLLSEPEVDNFPLERLGVPTLVGHAADDALARYGTAPPAAARIPGARLVTIPRGGHLYLGAEARVRREVAAFIRAHLPRAALPGR